MLDVSALPVKDPVNPTDEYNLLFTSNLEELLFHKRVGLDDEAPNSNPAPFVADNEPAFLAILKVASSMSKLVVLIVVVVPLTVRLPAISIVVFDAPSVSVLAPTPSKIVLLPDVKSISVKPVSVVSVPPRAIVLLPIVILSFAIILFSTASAGIVNAIEVLPKFVIVPEPVASPVNVSVGSFTLKSKLLLVSSHVTLIPASILDAIKSLAFSNVTRSAVSDEVPSAANPTACHALLGFEATCE